MIIAPNITATPYAAPIHDVGMHAAVQDMTAAATQVSNASPYFKLENNNQQKQQAQERKLGSGASAADVLDSGITEEEAVTFGYSTLFLAQMMAQQAKASQSENVGTLSNLAIDVSAFDRMQMDNYSRTLATTSGIGILPGAQSFLI